MLEQWVAKLEKTVPQSLFWSIVMEMEQTLLLFVRALQESNFVLYLQTL